MGDRVEIYAEVSRCFLRCRVFGGICFLFVSRLAQTNHPVQVEGWYTGCNAEGRYGLFPANFAKRVDL